jgi:hypothetical protein
VPVVIKNSSNRFGRTIGYGTGFVNSTRGIRGALKPLEKPPVIREISADAGRFLPEIVASNQKHRFCALPEICC